MNISKILPYRFSIRLMFMTLLSGMVPIIVFMFLMQAAATRFPDETNKAIVKGEEEQWQKSEIILRKMAEDFIRQKAIDTALHMDLYLMSHAEMTAKELQVNEDFRKLAIQAVGTSYTAVFDSDKAVNYFHAVPKIQGMDISKTDKIWPDHWEIIKASLGGNPSKGYYKWKDPDGQSRDKFMYIAPLTRKTADGIRFNVAATTYVDDFFQPLVTTQEVSRNMATRLMDTVNELITSFRDTGFMLMALGIMGILLFSCLSGAYFSRAIIQLRNATKKVNQGDFGVLIEQSMSGDIGELIDDFNQMVKQLAETTVKKEELEISEGKLKNANNKLLEEIYEREQAQEALKESEEKFRSIVENSHNGIAILDNEYRLVYINDLFCRIVGYPPEELIGQKISNYISKEGINTILDLDSVKISSEGVQDVSEFKVIRKGENARDVEARKSVITDSDGNKRTILQILDITDKTLAKKEQKQLEAKLHHAQRMEVIGTLASGVAHDLNNILSGLVSYPELLLIDLEENSPLGGPLLTIKKSGEKAAAIVQDLLTLARRGVCVKEPVDLNRILFDYINSPEHDELKRYHQNVKIDIHYEDELPLINGSPVHLAKTVMNLVSNAAEAIPDGGKIVITTGKLHIEDAPSDKSEYRPGDYVILTVTDTGVGISPEDREKIFEPFYTKKVMGRTGTGLGMAVVWGAVKDHNGYIRVTSDVNKGTRFTLYFPQGADALEPGGLPLKIEDYTGNGEKILVVDDVRELREIATGILQRLGYNVKNVSSGEEAVSYLKTHDADLILLDMIMEPGIDGLETYRQILKGHPGQKVIIASGYSETERVKAAIKLGAGSYIKKPYLLEKIGVAVKKELQKK